jgi:NADH dehydrogenase [ubiquinone] 1 alpha subcomplex assembly factor 5
MSSPVLVFDRHAVRRHRDRAARRLGTHDFLFREASSRLAERLDDMNRTFPLALELGAHGGILSTELANRGGIETLVRCDVSAQMVRAASGKKSSKCARAIVSDEEYLPFAPNTFDLIISCLSLHWVNDLPGALIQARRCLKPDGLFLAAIFGSGTLLELRQALLEAEMAESGGAGPRVSPFTDVRDAGSLLMRAGFALPVVDIDSLTVSYRSALDLMRDLRGMGEANAVAERRRSFTRRSTILRAAAIYADCHADASHRIPATFQILTLTGWAPHAMQPKALRPGSATHRLAEALDTSEIGLAQTAVPDRRR